MRIELALAEQTILREIADSNMTQNDVAMTYALAMKSSECERVDWAKVNTAIIARWSISGLKRIKESAWSGKCFETPPRATAGKEEA